MVDAPEMFCLVVYDVVENPVRQRVSEACLDYGLERFQMSAFSGYLTAPRRKELFHRLAVLLGESPGRILVQPVCSEDADRRLVLHQKGEAEPENSEGEPPKKHREFPEPGAEKPTILKL